LPLIKGSQRAAEL